METFGEDKNHLRLTRIEPRYQGFPFCGLAAVPTRLSRFPARIKVDPSVVCFVLRSRWNENQTDILILADIALLCTNLVARRFWNFALLPPRSCRAHPPPHQDTATLAWWGIHQQPLTHGIDTFRSARSHVIRSWKMIRCHGQSSWVILCTSGLSADVTWNDTYTMFTNSWRRSLCRECRPGHCTKRYHQVRLLYAVWAYRRHRQGHWPADVTHLACCCVPRGCTFCSPSDPQGFSQKLHTFCLECQAMCRCNFVVPVGVTCERMNEKAVE